MRLCEEKVKSGKIQKNQGESATSHGKNGSWQCEKWREVRLKTRNHRLDVGTISAA